MKQKCENENCRKFGEITPFDYHAGLDCQECGNQMKLLVDRCDHHFLNNKWTEITEELYMYFLEVLPPSFGPNNTFAVGEPLRDNEFGRAEFTICRRVNRKFYCIEGTLQAMFSGALGSLKHDVLPTMQEQAVSG